MSAPEGNQFWKLRSKHGRDKLFASPELLWEAACEYFEWVDENPFIKTKSMVASAGFGKGSYLKMVEIPKPMPYTIIGLCLFLGCSTSYFRSFKANAKESKEDFLMVIGMIQDVIYNNKFSGAVVGFFNANIISRDLGLVDKVNTEIHFQRVIADNRKTTADLFPPELEFIITSESA